MPGLVVSHSDIKAFLTCRRKWAWQYVADFKSPEKRTGPLALGNRVHASIEVWYRDFSDAVAEHERLANEAVKAVEDDPSAPPWEIDQLYKDIVTGRRCVEQHQEWLATTGADMKYEIVGVEKTVEAPILGGRITLRGKVDVLFRDIETGFILVNDLKTAAKKTVREEFERSYQHHVYMAALRISEPSEVVNGAMYTVMYKNAKTDPLERFSVPGSTRMADTKLKQIEMICAEMLRSMANIETEGIAHAYPTPQDACRWCEFRHPCEVLDESTIAARELLDKNFKRGGRFERYGPS